MSDPSEIQKMTLEQVRTTLLKMTAPEWELNLTGATDEEKAQSNKQLLQLQQARLALGNAVLSDIRDKLVDNEADLQQGIGDVSEALGNLEDVAQVLGTVSSLLTTVGKVVSLP